MLLFHCSAIRRRDRLDVACVAIAALAIAPAAWAESLSDAVAAAIARNPKVEAARARALATTEGVTQARAGYLPTIAAHGSAGQATDPRHPSLDANRNARSYGYDVMISQPVFDGGRAASAVAGAKANAAAEQETARAVEQQIVLAGVTAYAEVLSNRRVLRINDRNATLLEQTQQATRRQLDAREATRADLAQADAALAGAQAQRDLANANLASSEATFEEALLHAPGRLEPLPVFDHLLPPTRERAVELAERESSSVIIALLREQGAHQAINQARAKLLPTIDLQAGYERASTPLATDFGGNGGLVARVVGTIPIFSGGATEAEVRAASFARTAAVHQVADTRAQARTAVIQAWSRMVAARAALRSIETQQTSTRQALAGIMAERKLGQRTVFELINAQQALQAAETSQAETQRNLVIATCTVLLLSGRLDAHAILASTAARTWTASVSPKTSVVVARPDDSTTARIGAGAWSVTVRNERSR